MKFAKPNYTKLVLRNALLLVVLLCSFVQLAGAERFEVSHAQTEIVDGTYFLSADIAYSLHSQAQDVLQQGLPIKVVLEVELFRARRYWTDKVLLRTSKSYFLQFNSVTERYVVSVPDEGSQSTYATAEEAVASLRYLQKIKLSEVAKTPDSAQARARLLVDVRHFPDPLQYLARYWADWVLVSDWYVWPLKL